jgi:hypothetical protein
VCRHAASGDTNVAAAVSFTALTTFARVTTLFAPTATFAAAATFVAATIATAAAMFTAATIFTAAAMSTAAAMVYRSHQAKTLSTAMNISHSVQFSWLRDIRGRLTGAGGGGSVGRVSGGAEVVVVIGTLGGGA